MLRKSFLIQIISFVVQSDPNFAQVTTAELSWHVQNSELIGSLLVMPKWNVFSQGLDNELKIPLWNGSDSVPINICPVD